MANTITVEIELDEKGAVKGLKEFEGESGKSGKKAGDNFEKGFSSSVANIAKTVAKVSALVGAAVAALGVKQSITAAIAQEEAVQSLNSSLSLAGEFSRKASEDIQQFASNLQEVTTVGDETTLALFSLARNLTKTNEQAKRLTEGAIQLSAATGLSLDSSVKNLGKSLGGLTGELGESLPQIKQFTVEQLKAGAALDFVLERFGGAAESKVNTFAGAIKQLSNAYGDSLEQQGFLITKSPILIGLIQKLTKFFAKSAESTRKFRQEVGDIFKPLANGLITVGNAVNKFLIRPLNLVFTVFKNVFSRLFKSVGNVRSIISKAFSKVSDVVKEVFSRVSIFAEIAFEFLSQKAAEASVQIGKSIAKGVQFLQPFVAQITGFLTGILGETNTSINQTIDNLITKLTTVIEKFRPILERFGFNVDDIVKGTRSAIEGLIPEGDTIGEKFDNIVIKFQSFTEQAKAKLGDLKEIIKQSIQGQLETPLADAIQARLAEMQSFVDQAQPIVSGFAENASIATEAAKDSFLGLTIGFGTATKEMEQQATRVAATIRNALGNGIAKATQLLVKNLQAGKSAFDSFGKFVFGVFGDLATQLGQFFIIQGIAVEALKSLGGAAAVAAGIALVALGTLLKGFSGGGGSSSSSSSSSGGFSDGGIATNGGAVAVAEPQQEQQTTNQIIVQGDVFDSEETGLRIFDIISEQSEKNGNVIIGGAFA